MSNYIEAFTTTKYKDTNKPIIQENNRKIPNKMQKSEDPTTTTFTQLHSVPSNVIQDNTVRFDLKNNHSWSNSRGYGNVIVGTYDSCSNIHGKVHPWNRFNGMKTKRLFR